jgi:DNA mismatch endonuclease (patch repair protein)
MASRSENMRAIRRRDTTPELQIRSLLHRAGLRYRVDYRVGTGRSAPRPDIAFTRAKVAVFIDGCFWHRCPEHSTMPKTNREFWAAKLQRNTERDRDNDQVLDAMGWTVIRAWEHEPAAGAAARIIELVPRTPPQEIPDVVWSDTYS